MYLVATAGCEPERPHDPKSLISGIGPVVPLVAGRGRGDFADPSAVRTHAQSRAEIELPRARGPYTARNEFSLETVVRTVARTTYRSRFRVAYGQRRAQSGAQRSDANDYIPNVSPYRTHDREFPLTLGFSTDEPSEILPSVPPLKRYAAPTVGQNCPPVGG